MRIKPRFSLRMLLLLVTAIALLLGWKTNREQEREKAIAALCNAGANVIVEDSLPSWVKCCFGQRTGQYVIAVGPRGSQQPNGSVLDRSELWERVGISATSEAFTGLDGFFCLGCSQGRGAFAKLTAADIAHLSRFVDCKFVDLSGTAIPDIALAHLGGLHKLEYLLLIDTGVSDAGLEQLHGLKSLQRIYLGGTRVTDAGIDALVGAIPGIEIYSYLGSGQIR